MWKLLLRFASQILRVWLKYTSAPLRKNCPYSELFWSAFSRIWTKYEEILRISPYSVRTRENAHQNNSEYGHFSRSDGLLNPFLVNVLILHPPENTENSSSFWYFRGKKWKYWSEMVQRQNFKSKIETKNHQFMQV